MRVQHIFRFAMVAGLGLALAACGSSSNDDTNTLGTNPYVTPGGTARVFAQYDVGTMPLPSDLPWELQRQPTDDPAAPAPVRLPVEADDSADLALLKGAVNAMGLAGLSPNMFLSVPVTGEVDPTTLKAFVLRIDGGATEILTEAAFHSFYSAGVLKMLPLQPFTPGAQYAVALKTGLEDANGEQVSPSFTMTALKSTVAFSADSPFASLEPLRAKFNAEGGLFDAVAGATQSVLGTAWTRTDILALWTFHTASMTLSLTPTDADPANQVVMYSAFDDTLATFKGLSAATDTTGTVEWLNPATGWGATPFAFTPAQVGLDQLLPDVSHLGSVYSGRFQGIDLDPTDLDTGLVTFTVVTPDTGTCGNGPYTVSVFQHGIGRSKDDGMALANTLGGVCIATLTVDAPFHGDRTPSGTNPDTGADYQSGELFFTANLIKDRSNIYQAALDLWELFDLIDAGVDLGLGFERDLTNPRFVAHSLGSIIGSAFLSQDDRPEKILLSSPSAQLANVLDATALPDLQALVASLGFTPGTTDYYVFLDLVQWLLDPVDAAYTGIGENDTDKVAAVYAYGDPVVSPTSTFTFLSNAGLATTPDGTVDPSATSPTQPVTAGTYQYGIALGEGGVAVPVVHSFLLSPSTLDENGVTVPYYVGFDPAAQVTATTKAQTHAAAFLAPSPD